MCYGHPKFRIQPRVGWCHDLVTIWSSNSMVWSLITVLWSSIRATIFYNFWIDAWASHQVENRNPVQKVHRAFRRQLPKFNEDGRRNYGFHDGASWVCPEKIVGRRCPNRQLMTIVATNPANLELKDAKSDPSSSSTPCWTPTWSHGWFPENFHTRRGSETFENQ